MLMERFDGPEREAEVCMEAAETNSSDQTIYAELGELAKFVESTTRAIRDMEAPVATTTEQLPQANDYLAELSRRTEEGTHKVMGLTESIEENRVEVTKILAEVDRLLTNQDCAAARVQLAAACEKLAQDESRLLDVSVALSFQDLSHSASKSS